jgi:tRNA (guanine37-N1)-methyltransferase
VRIDVVTIFPAMFDAVVDYGVVGKAIERSLLQTRFWNPRDYTVDNYRRVDDRPYGGGPGMVMLAEPLEAALADARRANPSARVVLLSPQGRRLDHAGVLELAGREGLILLAARYEGVDERLIESQVDEEWSIGDYVLTGGELAAMVLIDAVARQLPGVVGNIDSVEQESFAAGLLDCPHYTRPVEYRGLRVPEVLMSGNHEQIRRWRLKQSLGRTWLRRPDLLAGAELDAEQLELLDEFQREYRERQETE